MTKFTDLSVGDVMPIERHDRPLAEPCDEAWFILVAAPQKDGALRAYLETIGAVEAWRPIQIKWRAARGPRKRAPYEASAAPGYVFALFDRRVRWHVLKEQAGRRMRHVVSRHEQPLAIDPAVISAMQQVPGRIEILRKRQVEEEERRLLDLIPQPGDKRAKVTIGGEPLMVDVENIHRGVLHFVLRGIHGKVKQAEAMRVKE